MAGSMRSGMRFEKPIMVTKPIIPDFEQYSALLKEVWAVGIFTNNGPMLKQLEVELTRHLRAKFVSLFNNGTVALDVACHALNLTGEVVVTPFTFAATAHVLEWNKITPVFVDIDPETMTINASRIETAITDRTTGILGVHVYGTPCDVNRIDSLAERHGLKVLYDAAHAFGTKIDGVPIGEFGHLTMLSFHATKLFHTAEGGGLIVNDPALYETIGLMKNFGIKDEERVSRPGINGKLNELQAALGLCTLRLVEHERLARFQISEIYHENLSGVAGLKLPKRFDLESDSLQYFCIRVSKAHAGRDRDHLHRRLKDFNIYARKYFYPLCSDFDCYKHLASSSKDNLPVANLVASEVLCLPFYGSLDLDDAARICSVIKEILSE